MAPDSSSLRRDHPASAMRRTALVVNNPTLDLPLAATEGAITIGHLNETGFEVRALNGDARPDLAIPNDRSKAVSVMLNDS